MKRFYRMVAAGVVVAAAATCPAAGQAGAAPSQATNVVAQALMLGQEVRSRMARLEHVVFDPAVTSEEIEALRKRSNALDLILSGELTEGDRERLRKERTAVRQDLRAAVFAHPDVKRAVADLEVEKARLVELNQRILEIRRKQKQQREREGASTSGGAGSE